MPRKIILPRDIEERLRRLTNMKEETNGVLLYQRDGDECLVDYLYLTAVGSSGRVQAMSDRIKVANEFFQKNSQYKHVKFHTHTRGTVKRFGRYFAQNFSSEDRKGIKEQLMHNEDFIAMLVTPEVLLVSGIDNPTVEVVEGFPEYKERRRHVEAEITKIARELGVELEPLVVTELRPKLR